MKILVSKCLLGCNCKYNGGNNLSLNVKKICDKNTPILICPEELGGLTTPRVPSEIRGNLVVSKDLRDVTDNFVAGAKKSLEIALNNDIKVAILKESSPSCGVNTIYDGSFTGIKIKGSGITTRLLKENGIRVFSEKDDLDEINM